MIDGRFDQHFAEIFAQAELSARQGDRIPWLSLVSSLALVGTMGVALILFG